MKKITLWFIYEDGSVRRKTFSSFLKAVSWLNKHPEVVNIRKVLE